MQALGLRYRPQRHAARQGHGDMRRRACAQQVFSPTTLTVGVDQLEPPRHASTRAVTGWLVRGTLWITPAVLQLCGHEARPRSDETTHELGQGNQSETISSPGGWLGNDNAVMPWSYCSTPTPGPTRLVPASQNKPNRVLTKIRIEKGRTP